MRFCDVDSEGVFLCVFWWNRKEKKSPRAKGRKKKKQSGPKTVEEIVAEIGVEEINAVLSKLNMHVPERRVTEPTYKAACWDVATSVTWAFTELLFRARWALKYNVLGQDYSQDDREHLCMKHHQMTDEQWEATSQQKRDKMLSKGGVWNQNAAQSKKTK